MGHRPPCSGYHSDRVISALPSNQVRELIRDFGPAAPAPGERLGGSGCAGEALVRRGVPSHLDAGPLEGCGQGQRNSRGQPAAGSGRGRPQPPEPLPLEVSSALAGAGAAFPASPRPCDRTSPAASGARGVKPRAALPVTPSRGALGPSPTPSPTSPGGGRGPTQRGPGVLTGAFCPEGLAAGGALP